MLVRTAGVAALLVTLQTVATAYAEEIRLGPGMAERLQNIQIFVDDGRIRAMPSYLAAPNLRETTKRTSTLGSESLTVAAQGGAVSIEYQQRRSGMLFSIELVDGDSLLVKVESQKHDEWVPLRFEQMRRADLRLSVGTEENRREITGPSIWHLLLIEPELCRQHLVPLLQLLEPDLRLMAIATAVEKSLLEIAASETMQDRRPLGALVARLGSEQFEERRAAERELQQLGAPALPYLLSLDLSLLDAEQRRRVRLLRAGMMSQRGGGARQIAAGLSGDRSIWLSLMQRSEAGERRLAAKQLADLLERNVEFDADADEPTRAAQLERLRLELASRPGALRD